MVCELFGSLLIETTGGLIKNQYLRALEQGDGNALLPPTGLPHAIFADVRLIRFGAFFRLRHEFLPCGMH